MPDTIGSLRKARLLLNKRHWLYIVILMAIAFGLFFSPPSGRSFQRSIESAFENRESSIFLSDITEFDWKLVCFIPPHAEIFRDELETNLGTGVRGRIRLSSYWPFYSGAFVFSSGKGIDESITYYTKALAISPEGIQPPTISIGGLGYHFLTEDAFDGDLCLKRDQAVFKKVARGNSRIIRFSNRGEH